ncbi:hypothetical protein ABZ848_35525 [Streptomyces sp. NPDC047081]|uniref:hypothetical protein n=1 Tax=Streptomyces sp. NPDC047081 TaxID=3154706 RepID=UPI0033CE5B80
MTPQVHLPGVELKAKFEQLLPHLDERRRRLYLASEAIVLGHGGITLVAAVSETSTATIARGKKNLCEAVEKCVAMHRSCLAEPTEGTPADATAEPEVSGRPEGMRVIRRRERHAAVHALYDKGVPIQAISETLRLDRKTVRRYAHAVTPEEATLGTGSRRYGQVHAYSPYLHRRWNEGCTDAARLHAEISELGFTGSKRTMRRHLQEIRASGKPAPDKPKTLTVRTATWLITSHPDHLWTRAVCSSSRSSCRAVLNWTPSPRASAPSQ